VLEHLGFRVVIPAERVCCGRPLYDFGMLDLAQRYLERTLDVLAPHVAAGTPMVVLEPSCCSVFRDELGELLPGRNEARNLKAQTYTLSEFLAKHVEPERIPRLHRKAIVQTHCHHHAVMRFDAERQVFDAMGLDYEVLASGCCGMAGSFGFEKDKYDVSQACGERVLLPRVREADPGTLVLADGFSCRTQIAQNGDRRAVHLADALAMALEHGPTGPVDAPFVETASEGNAPVGEARRTRRAPGAHIAAAFVLLALAVLAALAGYDAKLLGSGRAPTTGMTQGDGPTVAMAVSPGEFRCGPTSPSPKRILRTSLRTACPRRSGSVTTES
jgi:hypothetical protein